ncbi:PD-(D/E)XK nuclease family transposase [Thiothrix eikelboomii]|uniref:PD-(D/E)XK nuclease family transposase n=1 Tax=Thiothrix eikelboomii TaxID=92487 RepID=A0A1T4VTM0_9GAMM|nr:PD-(D/E)XK nuclease family transposase [Thiothrix eikelboomii]
MPYGARTFLPFGLLAQTEAAIARSAKCFIAKKQRLVSKARHDVTDEFANGAMTAAFVHLFNAEWSPRFHRPEPVMEYETAAPAIETGVAVATTVTDNFEVADFHTYFVGQFGAWVHNSCWRRLDELIPIHSSSTVGIRSDLVKLSDDMHPIYLNPLTDFGLKKLFGEEPNKDLLISFLNTLLPAHH